MELLSDRLYQCDEIKDTDNKKTFYCQELIISKKDIIHDKIWTLLSSNQILSIFSQIVYALLIMHKNGFYHFDSKIDNIALTKTNMDYVYLGNVKIPTYGYVASLIDYGNVVSDTSDLDDKTKERLILNKKYDIDLWLLIDYVLLGNAEFYKQVPNKKIPIALSPLELYNVIKDIDKIDLESVINHFVDIHYDKKEQEGIVSELLELLQEEQTIESLKKSPALRTIMYEFTQIMQIIYPDKFIGYMRQTFIENNMMDKESKLTLPKKIDYKLIHKIKEIQYDYDKIINFVSKYL
jgi:serine/threonine protein kinase